MVQRRLRIAADRAEQPTDLRSICCALAVALHSGRAADAEALRAPFVRTMLAQRQHNASGEAGAEQFVRTFDAMLRAPHLVPFVNEWMRLVR